MPGFIIAIILGVVAILALVSSVFVPRKIVPISVFGGAFVLSAILLFSSMAYTNDEGQAKVLRAWTGDVQGQVTTPGFGWKKPWQQAINYDVRNQQVVFAAPSGTEGALNANGPQITIQDKEGVSANIDITVRYSVKPDAVSEIYKRYGSQESFVAKFIENDIRAAVRTVPTAYNTLELLNSRALVEKDITDYLETRWDKQGVQVETVSLQEIRYGDAVKDRFDAAQTARIEIEKAQAELEATQVSAKQKIVQAEAEAEANRILTQSLTDEVLTQRYLDTLKDVGSNGNMIIVPEGLNGIVNLK